MAWWWNRQGSGNEPVVEKSARKPGPGWVVIAGATDSMTQAQAEHVLAQDVLHDNPGFNIGPGVQKVGQTASNAAVAAAKAAGLGGVEGFLAKLGDPHLWLRIAEGILGIILIATSVSKLTGAGSAVGKVARKVPLVV